MGCCNKRNKETQKLAKSNYTAFNKLEEARKNMYKISNMNIMDIDNDPFLNDLNNLIELGQDDNLFKPDNNLFKRDNNLFKQDNNLFKPDNNLFKQDNTLFKQDNNLFKPANSNKYEFVFGRNYSLRYKTFLEDYEFIFQISNQLTTTFYTFGYEDIQNIIDDLKTKIIRPPIISDKLYNFVTNNINDIMGYKNYPNLYNAISQLLLKETDDGTDFQTELIISTLKFLMLNSKFTTDIFNCTLAKLFQDIGFCIRIFYFSLKNELESDPYAYNYDFDIRVLYFLNMIESLSYPKPFPPDLLKFATESARIKDTIILGNPQFRKSIKDLYLKCARINEVYDYGLETFFQTPFLEKNKYKVVKYFVICDYPDYPKYFARFKDLSSKYGFAYLFLVHVENIQLVKILTDLKEQNSVIYFNQGFELREIYKDNNERLRPRLREYMKENFSSYKLDNMNFEKDFIYTQINSLKSTSEDGWDLFEYKKDSLNFNISFRSASFQDFIRHIIGHLINAYRERNTLDTFLRYYSNYFFLNLQPELVVNMTAFAKMFLYAYTLEEQDPNKSLYCIVNDDLRSCQPQRVNRYTELIKVIGALVKLKRLKSYTGYVYRASFLKEELIKNIKIGDIIINSAFWSSTKKESVAKKFLSGNRKNALIITKGELINNIDIHSEKMSGYPDEEEVLFLPFCNFRIVSFEIVNDGYKKYYKLVLKSVSQTSLIEPYHERYINIFNCEDKEVEDDNTLFIKFDLD